MPAPTYYHLKATDYAINFPASLDVVPVLIDKRTYFDDWIMNFLFAAIANVEQYLIDNKVGIED
jgi:hypothetical protein